jgi:hypothetical protein
VFQEYFTILAKVQIDLDPMLHQASCPAGTTSLALYEGRKQAEKGF